MTPNEAHFGFNPILPIDHNTIESRSTGNMTKRNAIMYQRYITKCRNIHIQAAKLKLDKYDEKRKAYYDRNKRTAGWKRGDKVLYWPGPKGSAAKMLGTFAVKWEGPYRIVKSFNKGANWIIQETPKSEPFTVSVDCLRIYRDREDEENIHRVSHKDYVDNNIGNDLSLITN